MLLGLEWILMFESKSLFWNAMGALCIFIFLALFGTQYRRVLFWEIFSAKIENGIVNARTAFRECSLHASQIKEVIFVSPRGVPNRIILVLLGGEKYYLSINLVADSKMLPRVLKDSNPDLIVRDLRKGEMP